MAEAELAIVALADVPLPALADFLEDFAPGELGPRDFAESLGHVGPAAFASFWSSLAAGPRPELGLVRTDALILMRGERALGEALLRHTLTPRLEQHGGHIGYTVRASERNRGYATLLLRAALARAATAGIERALLTVRTDNAASLRVVEKCGGVLRDEVPYGGGVHRRFWVPTHPG